MIGHRCKYSNISGDVLLSQAVTHQVSSALKSLTSVFGMGTGVSSLLLSPDNIAFILKAFRILRILLYSIEDIVYLQNHIGKTVNIFDFMF